jgi:hypothetical protein
VRVVFGLKRMPRTWFFDPRTLTLRGEFATYWTAADWVFVG